MEKKRADKAAPSRSDGAANRMEKKRADKAAPSRSDAAANRVDHQHHHHHPLFGVDHQHRAPASAPANRVNCKADINGCIEKFIKGFHRQLEDQEMDMKNNTSSTTTAGGALSLTSLNHISLVCRSMEKSLEFYQNVLGFNPIRRPESLKFDGAWLSNNGMVIHLLQSEDPEGMPRKSDEINPKDNHFSFQCESMAMVEWKLMNEMQIRYIKRTVEEGGGVSVDQLFFHDPDGFMIEICNREVLHDIPITGGDPVLVCKRATAAATCSSTP